MEITLELEKLNDKHCLSDFQCGNAIIDTEVCTNAHFYNITREASSFVISRNKEVIGCVIMGVTTIKAHEDENVEEYNAIEIRTLAIIQAEQGKHYGTIVLKGLISQSKNCADFCGCRYLVLTPVPDRIDWYEQRGFVRFPAVEYENKMYIDFRNIEEYNEYAEQ